MFRRHFLMGGIGIATAGTAFANSDGKLVSSIVEAIGAGGPVMIHVTAPWCGACKVQKPIVAALLTSPDFKDVKKFDVDFDTQKDVLVRYRIQRQSTMVVFNGGKEVDRQTGQTRQAGIEALLRKAL
jgi:thiol-disulfide isomerase/thioredoxin